MIKVTSKFAYALTAMLLCSCATASPPNQNELNNPIVSNRSAGCSAMSESTMQESTGNFMPIKTQVLNQDRTYQLRIPSTYNPNIAYPLIFRWHGAGGDGLSGGLNIEYNVKDDAIIVSADGLNNYWRTNADSIDLPFFDKMLETVSSQYCIDGNRIFSFGFSSGGSFSNLLACQRGDVLRANAAIASGVAGNNCKGKVATWLLHDVDDNAVLIANGKAALARTLATNGCSKNTVDEGNGCMRYQGCDAAPVVWCESKGFGHNIRGDYAPAQVWQFFQSLK